MSSDTHKPQFLVIEGPDGGGKTTQIKLLRSAFEAGNIPLTTTREPGGTPGGVEIRAVLLVGGDAKLLPLSEAMLFTADRHETANRIIRPALNEGRWVVQDRSFLTTLAYQGYGRGMDLTLLNTLTDIAIGDTRPDLIFILDVPPAVSLARKAPQIQEGLTESRFESLGEDFHAKGREGFLTYAREHPDQTKVIDATADESTVHRAIVAELNQRFGLTLQPQA